MPAASVPTFYRLAFTYFDPLVAFWASYMSFTDPDTIIAFFAPNTTRDPNLDMFFQQTGGYTLALCFLQTVLLRATADVRIWKILQCATLIIDVAMLYSLCWGLNNQGRLGLGSWKGEDWGCVLVTLVPTVYRAAFVAELGFRRGKGVAVKSA